MVMFSLCSNVETTKLNYRQVQLRKVQLASRFARGLVAYSAGLLNARCFVPLVQECVSMVTLVCALSPTVLTNHEPSELVAEHISYAWQ